MFREALVQTVPFLYFILFITVSKKPCLESDLNNSSKQSLAKPLPYVFPFNQLSAFYFLFVYLKQAKHSKSLKHFHDNKKLMNLQN